ncbi:hypothetical protein PPROV_001123900 [Pycnococcus provasolii]|uniref:FAD-binding domain-containing protein n=1 Tax=Pycnococcus provasolii TaxID=41880 RepID=A0A830I473_9CHLO|nr:hypothetical protein PPROV_001123900 [Pycnococcus provasolii]
MGSLGVPQRTWLARSSRAPSSSGAQSSRRSTRSLGSRQQQQQQQRKNLLGSCSAALQKDTTPQSSSSPSDSPSASTSSSSPENNVVKNKPKVLIAGGGIGGLTSALACRARGIDCVVFERVGEYKPFGGPIQLQCNALSALETIDREFADEVIAQATITGDRLNGLLDGITGEWFMKFDTREPCRKNGLPLTLVISRYLLLDMLRKRVGPKVLRQGVEVVRYEHIEGGKRVRAHLDDGTYVDGDALVGSDGIRSIVRSQMRKEDREAPLRYSGYTVYTAVCDFTGIHTEVDKTGYQVFLGKDAYFVASDVGNGQQQYYAFLAVPPGGEDEWAKCERWSDTREMLLERFGDWCPAVKERLECTKPEDIERRDVYDIAPDPRWVDGRVALLGDSCHAVQPNLGQGGCQAIEGAKAITDELSMLTNGGEGVEGALMKYASRRFLRSASVSGFSRMAALMNTVYKPYLGSDPYGFYPDPVREMWLEVEKAKIPHPGRVIGQLMMFTSMQGILEYVGAGKVFDVTLPQSLGGACKGTEEERVPYCQVPGVSVPDRESLSDDDFKMKGIPGFAK